ncbi:hypothetical protein J7K50_05615 [bacterium]|nr:hypothetical protein [bacterium]
MNDRLRFFGVDSDARLHARARGCARMLLLLTILFLAGVAGCGKGPSIKSIKLTGEGANRTPDEARLLFVNDAEPVILVLDVGNIYAPVSLETTWKYMPRQSIVFESEDELKESGTHRIRLNRKAGESELGDYRIDISLNGVPVSVAYFTITGELSVQPSYEEIRKLYEDKYGKITQPAITEDATLSDFAIAASVYGLTQAPKEITSEFEPDAPVIYLTMFLSSAPEGTKVRVDWYYLGKLGKEERLIIPAELETSGTRQLAFNMKPGVGDLPVGMYEARVSLNGEEVERVPFSVMAPPNGGNAGSEP